MSIEILRFSVQLIKVAKPDNKITGENTLYPVSCQLDASQLDAVNFQRANKTRPNWTRPNETRPR